MKIIEKKENPLLSRTEISAEITFDKATPSNEEVKKLIAAELKVDEALVVVKTIYTEFGSPNAKVTAFVYSSKEALEKTEPKPKVKEGAKPATEKPAEKPAEAPKEEKKEEAPKKEEAKEESKEEKKEEAPPASESSAEEGGKKESK